MSKHGENIRKRKDGRWEGRYIKGRNSDRTAIWGYIYGHSYNEVKEKLTIKKMEVQQFALNVENPTFSELSLTWESSIFLGVKSSTAAHYHYTLQHYILPVLGPYRVQALNESILESSLLEIIAPADQNHKTLGNAMGKECLTLVRRICRYAVHLHIMHPIEIDLKLPAVNPSNASVLNTVEQKSVCAFVRSSPTPRRLGMLLMMQMGLRIGEVCGLQWGDFDLQNGVLSVRRTVKRIYMAPGKTTLVTQSPKTQSSERDIPIPTGILSLLKEEYVGQSKEVWFLSDTDLAIVFGSLSGYIGGFFSAVKNSKIFAQSTVVGAVSNIVLNLVMTPFMGALGAAIATAVCYFVVWVIRYWNSKKFIKLKINLKRDLITYVLLAAQSIVLLLEDGIVLYGVEIGMFLVIVILYAGDLMSIAKKGKQAVQR